MRRLKRDPSDTVDIMEETRKRFRTSPRGKFMSHKMNAKKRGIEFKLSFDEWWIIWDRSGKYEQRGNKADQYQMCRIGDAGCYEINNVFIGLGRENKLDGAKKSADMRRIHTAKSTTVLFTGE